MSSVTHTNIDVANRRPHLVSTSHVESVGMTVENVDRSVAFYRNVLGFQLISETDKAGPEFERLTGLQQAQAREVRLRLGDEWLVLTEFITPRGLPFPNDSCSNDHWFQHVAIVVRDMDEAYEVLCRHGVEHASIAPQRLPDWNSAAAGIQAFYFRDPDGHYLEVIEFPVGKGLAKWHGSQRSTFLGVDHTAIVVRSTAASLRFYRDRLGMEVVGSSHNHGPEQEQLNNVLGAQLRITTLRAASGPGVELLEYVTPRTGRPRPESARPNDVLHWQTTIAVRHLNRRTLVSDPDGHVVELTASR
jgi:catechol 2,3-dioxygenase-like lactoylglutathione lyase family enzyme